MSAPDFLAPLIGFPFDEEQTRALLQKTAITVNKIEMIEYDQFHTDDWNSTRLRVFLDKKQNVKKFAIG